MVVDLEHLPELMNEKYFGLLKRSERYMIVWGGSGSGKSIAISQIVLVRMLIESGHRFLVLRKVHRTLKRSVYQLFRDIINDWGLAEVFNFNMTDMTITCKNGSQILFSGLDDVEKLKSIAGITSIWLEEATEMTSEDFEQVNLRLRGITPYPKQIYITFNPISSKHWIKKRFFEQISEDTCIVHSSYKDNRFLDQKYISVLEALIDTDKRLYDIYTLGKWGVMDGLIYERYELVKELPDDYEHRRYGLDFGYKNPMAMVEVRFIGKKAYLQEIYYQTEKTTEDLLDFLQSKGIDKHVQIRADSAEPDRIEQLCRNGFNVVPAKKNILAGIDAVQSYDLYITEDSINLIREIDTYRWAKDHNGVTLDRPVKEEDHILDSTRYAIFVDEVRSHITIGSARHTASIKFAGYDGGKISSSKFRGF